MKKLTSSPGARSLAESFHVRGELQGALKSAFECILVGGAARAATMRWLSDPTCVMSNLDSA